MQQDADAALIEEAYAVAERCDEVRTKQVAVILFSMLPEDSDVRDGAYSAVRAARAFVTEFRRRLHGTSDI